MIKNLKCEHTLTTVRIAYREARWPTNWEPVHRSYTTDLIPLPTLEDGFGTKCWSRAVLDICHDIRVGGSLKSFIFEITLPKEKY